MSHTKPADAAEDDAEARPPEQARDLGGALTGALTAAPAFSRTPPQVGGR
jgi:hypothetical protein